MAGGGEEEKSMEEELTYPIMIAEEIRKSVEDAESFKTECSEVGKQIDRLSQMLRTLVRLSTSTPLLYERPVHRIVSEVSRNLDRALTLVRKCKRSGIFNRLLTITITSVTDFRKLFNLLESSIGDMKWLLNVFDYTSCDSTNGGGGGIILSLAPIASNDPILSWVWSYIAAIQMGPLLDRIEAANQLATLAFNNDRNQKIIVEEGGVSPLLKLLKEGSSPDAQIAAANALCSLGTDQERVRHIVSHLGIPLIVQVLSDSPMRVQIEVAKLVSIMAKNDPAAQEEFAREKVIRPLVSFLSFETFVDEPKPQSGGNNKPSSLHSLVKINKELGGGGSSNSMNIKSSYPHSSSSSSLHSDGGSIRGGNTRKERDNEKPEVKLKLKINCAEALWMLSKGSVSNSQRITETKGLLCLARIIEKGQGELQYNCLMTLMEIAASAESNADLRRAAFKTNSPAAKAVVEQLLRVIREESSPSLQSPSIIAIGLLARTFTARETRVIGILVTHLSHKNVNVATEAAVALGKFVCPENFLCVEHSKTIIECDGITPLMLLLKRTEHAQQHGLILLCYLALNVGSSEALERARALNALKGVACFPISQQPPLRELIPKASYQLELYHEGLNSHRQSYAT